jgi:hypothetical protein
VPRTIYIGDIHACRDELEDLLDKAEYTKGDRVVSVGDMIVRGPDPAGTLALLRSIGALAVRGNHEARVLRVLNGRGATLHPSVSEQTRVAARALTEADHAWLHSLPLWLDIAEHRVRVVHAGVVPGMPIERQAPEVLMTIRSIGRNGRPMPKRAGRLWGKLYTGPPHIVFGHNALPDPQLHTWATGIDTACVYGGRLTALVLDGSQQVPPRNCRTEALVSVKARKEYVKVRD